MRALLVFVALLLATANAAAASPAYLTRLPHGHVNSRNHFVYPAGKPRGYVMLVHGGGWVLTGATQVPDPFWAQHGWAVYTIDYRPGGLSLLDTIAAYDHLRHVVGPHAKVCADGQSAGGQLVLMLAAARPTLSCAVSEGGVEDLRTLSTRHLTDQIPSLLAIAHASFDPLGGLARFSPITLPRFTVPLLAAGSSTDWLIDERQQLRSFKRAHPEAEVLLLPGDPAHSDVFHPGNFVHAGVMPQALRYFHERVIRLLGEAR